AVPAYSPFLRREGRRGDAPQWLLPAAALRGRARLRGRAARDQRAAGGISWPRRSGAGEPTPSRRAVLPAAAVRLAAQEGRQGAGGDLRDDRLLGLRRAARGGIPARRGAGASQTCRRGAVR